jgi:Ca-activated chloride channel family protein
MKILMKTAWLTLLCALPSLAAAQQDLGEGSLQIMGEGPSDMPKILPLKHTSVKAEISGFVVEVSLTQVFQNTADKPIEAVYVFPLPENAAVNEMTLTVADRVIKGQIKKRAEAREVYERAKFEGKTAALLDQERPNIFTQSVANIPPGKEITVQLRYLQTLKYEHSVYTFVFPMVVGPRYTPGGGAVPDAARISAPPVKPDDRPGRNISLSVKLDAGIEVREIRSKSHQVTTKILSGSKAELEIDPADSIPNKDFILTYRPAEKPVQTAVLSHKSGKEGYLTLMVQPKADFPLDQISPKELVFALDVSGSMMGFPVETSKALVRHCLDKMNPRDTFQILAFSAGNRQLFEKPLENTPENVARGKEALSSLHGGGGTEMLEAIRAVLEAPKDPNRLRIVMFMTDGFIGNEAQILSFVKEHQSGSRVFPLGVGSSPNRYLLEELAVMGRGSVQYVRQNESSDKLEKVIEDFYDRIAKPYLTDLEVDWGELRVLDQTPSVAPDLFAGQPVFLHARYEKPGTAKIVLKGKLGGRPWKMPVEVTLPAKEAGHRAMGPLWARARITDIERSMYKGENPDFVNEITRLALDHQLVSKYTSFVAVDETPTVAKGGKLLTVPVENPVPEGTDYAGFYGQPNQMATTRGMMRRASAVQSVRGAAQMPSEAFGGLSGGGSYMTRSHGPAPAAAPGGALGAISGADSAQGMSEQAAVAAKPAGKEMKREAAFKPHPEWLAQIAERMLDNPSKTLARKIVSLQGGPEGAFIEPDGTAAPDASQALGLLALAKAGSLYGDDFAAALEKAWKALKKKAPGMSADAAVLKLLQGTPQWSAAAQREFKALEAQLKALS